MLGTVALVGAVVVALVLGAPDPASARASSATRTERASVALLDTDQLGVALSRQAAGQSPDPATRVAAAELAGAYQQQADAIDVWLSRRGVGAAARITLREPSEVHALPPGMTCTLMRPGALGRLAGTGPARFDGAFAAMVRTHASMRTRAVAALARSPSMRRTLAGSQARLRSLERTALRAAAGPSTSAS
ncbi:MAG: hypothetical protein JWL73_1399 [Actinomycetia bacterium]|nr:hypothetical protein [Actinomycetes bacterium]